MGSVVRGLALLLCLNLPLGLMAQDLAGTWNLRGMFHERQGGLTADVSDINVENGTVTFTHLRNEDYNMALDLPGDNESFDISFTRVGNEFSAMLAPEESAQGVANTQVKLFLYDDRTAIVTALTREVSTESGLEGQSFMMHSTTWVLSRDAFPAVDNSKWAGAFALRRQGIMAVHGTDGFSDAVVVSSAETTRDPNGVIWEFDGNGNQINLGDSPEDELIGDENPIAIGFQLYNQGGLTITGNSIKWLLVAVQLPDDRVALLESLFIIGTVNTGSTDQYYVLYRGTARGAIASREQRQAPQITRQPSSLSVLTGGDAFLSVEASGLPTPSYEWQLSRGADQPWEPVSGLGDGYEGAASATLVVNSAAAVDGHRFRVNVSNAAGTATSDVATLSVLAEPTARLPNLSVRTSLAASQNLVVGFVMTGGSKPLVLRAIGPGLGTFGITDHMPDPRVTFFNSSAVEVAANDDWDAINADLFASLGAFALETGSKDAALNVTLSGASTASVTGGDAGGVVLIEVYDVGDDNTTRLANVSARNLVGTGNDVLIAGFVVQGDDPKNMLIRGIGPALAAFGLPGVLGDPVLEIYNSSNEVVASNDNWDMGLRSSFTTTGAFDLPDNSLDAALIVTLPPGAYSALLRGANGGTGEGLIEIYELP